MVEQLIDDSVSAETQKKIIQARMLAGRPHTERMIEYKNFAELFRKQSEKYSDKVYMVYRDGDKRLEITYKEIYKESSKLAYYMYKELGIRAGDRVSTVACNHHRTVVVYYATWLLGAVLVPINSGDCDENIKFVQDNSETKLVFVMPDLLERYNKIRSLPNNFENFVSMGSDLIEAKGQDSSGYIDLAEILKAEHSSENNLELDFETLADLDTEALIVYTSGTTGSPKGVVLDQYNVLVDAWSGGDNHHIGEDNKAMIILPIHHVNGLVVTLVTFLYYGASVVLNRKFSSSTYWEVAAKENTTCGSVVPTILAFLCDAGTSEYTEKIKDQFFIMCGAGPLTVDLVSRFEDKFGIDVMHGYGLSETTAFNCFIPGDFDKDEHKQWLRDYGYPSIGTPITCNEMAIHDEEGNELKEEERGEIVIRGHNVMKYYFKRPEVNDETFKNGWFRSGDEGFYKLDSKGRKQFFITGRLKELIIRGGVNYSTFEIDEVLNAISGVRAAMAVGFENDAYGEEVGAYVVLSKDSSLSEQDILEHCQEKLAFNKAPKAVVFGTDFPVTATGKYQRNKLKPLFDCYKAKQFLKK